jgi:GT2 family glycosyltransferase
VTADGERISIVVVAHDDWPHLEMAVSSALNQSYPALEVIVVDNGSQDGTAGRLAATFGDAIRYLRQENRLDGGGYNAGIRLAGGDFIQLLDGDDCLAPNKLEKQLAVFRAQPDTDIVCSEARYFNSEPGPADWIDRPLPDYPDILTALCEQGGNIGLTITSLYRRRVFEVVGPFDESIYGADYDFWFRAAVAGMRFRVARDTLVFYRLSARQMSRDRPRMLERAERTFEKAHALVRETRHRTLLADHLARVRLWRAMMPECGLDTAAALAKLEQARAGSRRAVALPVYLAAKMALRLPGGRRLFTSRGLRGLARRLR